jgi:uncharacterized protein YqhQ
MTSSMPYAEPVALQNPSSGVVSLVLGILGFIALPVLGSILALVFGYQSRAEVRANPEIYRDDYGKAGRILGWVGIALAGLILLVVGAGILFLMPVAVGSG